MSDDSNRSLPEPPALVGDLERLARALASVDDGIVRLSRRELLAELRAAVDLLDPLAPHGAARHARSALDLLDSLTPRAAAWPHAVRALRTALGALAPYTPRPLSSGAEHGLRSP